MAKTDSLPPIQWAVLGIGVAAAIYEAVWTFTFETTPGTLLAGGLAVAKKQADALSPLLWAIIGIGVGTAVYFAIKAAKKPPVRLPGTPTAPGLPTTTPSSPSPAPAPAPATRSAVVSRLSGSAQARKIFLFQAGMYSYAQIPDLPDGEFGAKTRQMIQVINNAARMGSASTDWSDAALQRLATGLKALNNVTDLNQIQARLVPSMLPASLIQQVNNDGVAVAADVPLLQTLPTA